MDISPPQPDLFETTARRQRQAVMPAGGRPEGRISDFLANFLPGTYRYANGLAERAIQSAETRAAGGGYNPAPFVETAVNMAGLGGPAAMTGAMHAGAAGSKMVQPQAITAYHGTTERGLKTLDPKRGIETPGATFHATNQDVAHTFTVPREYGEPVFYTPSGREIRPGPVYETSLTPKNLYEIPAADAQRFIDDSAFQNGMVAKARAAGHDALVARDVLEGIGERYRGDVYATLDPTIATILRKLGILAPLAAPAAQGLIPDERAPAVGF